VPPRLCRRRSWARLEREGTGVLLWRQADENLHVCDVAARWSPIGRAGWWMTLLVRVEQMAPTQEAALPTVLAVR